MDHPGIIQCVVPSKWGILLGLSPRLINKLTNKTRGPWALSLWFWCLTTCPDIQISLMSHGHVAEVKYLVFKVQVYLYSSVSLHDQNPIMIMKTKRSMYPIYMFTATPDFQISLRFSLRTPVLQLQAILRQVHQLSLNTLKTQDTTIKLRFIEIRADFRNYHIWVWNLSIDKSSRSCTYIPRGRNEAYFSLYAQRFPRKRHIFKIVIFGHKTWPLANVPEVAHIFSFHVVEMKLIFALRATGSEIKANFFLNFHIWAWHFATGKVPEVAHTCVLSFYPKGSKWGIFSLYGQRFPRYGPIFKIALFRYETWPLTKDSEVA